MCLLHHIAAQKKKQKKHEISRLEKNKKLKSSFFFNEVSPSHRSFKTSVDWKISLKEQTQKDLTFEENLLLNQISYFQTILVISVHNDSIGV